MSKNRLISSFYHALKGIRIVFKEERNFRIQFFIAIFVIILMNIFALTIIEKSILVLLIIAVLVLELSNSIIERLVDVFRPRVHNYIKDIKDIAAGAVLLTSFGAIAIAVIIFYPHIYDLICNWI